MNVVGVSAGVDRTTGGKGFGLEVQEESIREWAEKNGLELVAVLRDAGVWGTREAADRPGLSEAVSLVEIGEAKGIVVARLDRLARTLVVQDGILGKVWSMWARVDSTDAGEVVQDDPDDPMRTALRQIIGVFAQMERGMIAARLRAGRRHKHLKGGYAYGAPGYGFSAEGGSIIPVPHEQAVHRPHEPTARRWHVAASDRGATGS